MTTSSTFTLIDNSSDAGFRTWGTEFHAQLLACGLTLTSDTGQINWTTASRGGSSQTYAGYEIWRFNDTLQSTVPVFLKFEFGVGGTLNSPSIRLTVGSGTNGAGTMTGFSTIVFCGTNSTAGSNPLSTTAFYPSRFCYNAALGFFGFAWKIGANGSNSAVDAAYQAAFVFRSSNSAGAATSDMVMVLSTVGNATVTGSNGNGVLQCLNFANNTITPPNQTASVPPGWYWAFHPFMATATILNGQLAVDPVFFLGSSSAVGITPCLARGLKTEIPMQTQVSLTLVGATPHNYLQIGNPLGTATQVGTYNGVDAYQTSNANIGLLMLWE